MLQSHPLLLYLKNNAIQKKKRKRGSRGDGEDAGIAGKCGVRKRVAGEMKEWKKGRIGVRERRSWNRKRGRVKMVKGSNAWNTSQDQRIKQRR